MFKGTERQKGCIMLNKNLHPLLEQACIMMGRGKLFVSMTAVRRRFGEINDPAIIQRIIDEHVKTCGPNISQVVESFCLDVVTGRVKVRKR